MSRLLTKRSLLFCLLLCGALVPRVLARRDFVTVDEAYHWFDRVEVFLAAVQQGNYAGTNIIGHPGVTTMWLGALGRLVHLTLAGSGLLPHPDTAAEPFLSWAFLRFPVAFVTALCVPLAWLLLQRLFDERVALLAALFWATNPFLVAHSQLLHLDALLTSFLLVSLLALLAAFAPPDATSHPQTPAPAGIPVRWPLVVLSAMAGGLALLTKSPSVSMVPMAVLIIVTNVTLPAARTRFQTPVAWRTMLVACVVWVLVACVVWFALWPLAWVDPAGAVRRVAGQARYEGGTPHGWGNFFLGQAVDDPGPRFYPVVLALRMTPWCLVGLFAAGVVAFWGRHTRSGRKHIPARRNAPYALALLLFFVLAFVASMSVLPKKFDRYVLPVFPALDCVAAFGLVGLYDMVRVSASSSWMRANVLRHPATAPVLWLFAVAGLAFNLAWYHPYELAYYNPLLGGGRTATQSIPVGWGEGYEQAGAFISSQYNGCERAVASWFAPVLRPFLCNHWVVGAEQVFVPGAVDYAVVYIDQVQRRNTPAATAYLRSHHTPLHTVRIHGIDYATIYQLPLPNEHQTQAVFGSSLRLLGYDVGTSSVRRSGVLTLTTQWTPLEPVSQDYAMVVQLLDAAGTPVGQVDVPPGGPRAPTHTWKLHSYISWIHPLPVPPDLPPGRYWLAVGIYRPDDFSRLPVRGEPPPPDAPDTGPNMLVLQPVDIP